MIHFSLNSYVLCTLEISIYLCRDVMRQSCSCHIHGTKQKWMLSRTKAYEASRSLFCQKDKFDSPYKITANGVRFTADRTNAMDISEFSVTFTEGGGRLELMKEGRSCGFDFGLGYNKQTSFSFGYRARANMMGVYEDGAYSAVASAGFVDEDTLVINLQLVDTYGGKLIVVIHFGRGEASMHVTGTGQYVFVKMTADVLGKAVKE